MDAQTKTLRKLANGRINDAVLLAYHPEMAAEEISKLDLFNVAETSHDKGRGIPTIKFFDRFQALERLTMSERRKEATSLYDALYAGAATLRETNPDEE